MRWTEQDYSPPESNWITWERDKDSPFRPTCFDGYTLCISPEPLRHIVFSPRVIKLSDSIMLFDKTLLPRRLYMEYDMDFASDDARWQKICYSYEILLRNQ